MLLWSIIACGRIEPSADPRWNVPDPACPSAPGPAPAFAEGRVRFVTEGGVRHFRAERATTAEAQAQGLKYRSTLPLDHAMVFSTPTPEDSLFWMRGTCLALDLVWVDADGRVIEVQTAPAMEEKPRGAQRKSVHVIELGAGVAAANGIVAGSVVEVSP